MARPAKHLPHPFLLIEDSVKVWVRDYSAPGVAFPEDNGDQPLLPRTVGVLNNPLAFPLYLVRTADGEDVTAKAKVWDKRLVNRLRCGGDVPLIDSHPSKRYCRELLDYHFNKLPSSKQYEFAAYLRQLLEKTQAKLPARLRESHKSDITSEIADIFQTFDELLAYGLVRAEKIRDEARRRQDAPGQDVKYSGKIKTLAYLGLIKSGLVRRLSPQTELHVVQQHIAKKAELTPATVKRYILATLNHDSTYHIYTPDNRKCALEYIRDKKPKIDLTRVTIPLKW